MPNVRGFLASRRRVLKIAAVIVAALFGIALLLLAIAWPFTEQAIIRSMEQISLSEVRIGRYHEIFFPHAGYVAQNVTFVRDANGGGRPLVTISKITCRTTWLALITFTHRIQHLELEGLQVYIAAHVPPPNRRYGELPIKTTVTELAADGAVLDIGPRHAGGKTLRFEFPQLRVSNLARNKAIKFRAVARNPNPPGDLTVSGTFGPFQKGKTAQAQLTGSFDFEHANLNAYKTIGGILSASGTFNGILEHLALAGRAEIPDFEVTSSRHAEGISVEYRTIVNGMNGDVSIEWAEAHFLGTTLTARGSISGRGGKTVSLDLEGKQAQIQDLLQLFVTADRAPLDGGIVLHAHVLLPPSEEPFLERVQVDGDFHIADARFTNPNKQGKVNELSERAGDRKQSARVGDSADPALSDWRGDVNLRREVARISDGSFSVPGAIVGGAGTYNVKTEAIDLHGTLAIRASLSKAAGGLKSFFLIPLDPFFKKNGAGAVLAVRMSGTYSHPIFKVSLTRGK